MMPPQKNHHHLWTYQNKNQIKNGKWQLPSFRTPTCLDAWRCFQPTMTQQYQNIKLPYNNDTSDYIPIAVLHQPV